MRGSRVSLGRTIRTAYSGTTGSASCTPFALNAPDAQGAAPLHRALALGRGGASPPDNAAVLLQRGAPLAPPNAERHAHGPTAALQRFLLDAPRQHRVYA